MHSQNNKMYLLHHNSIGGISMKYNLDTTNWVLKKNQWCVMYR